MLAGMLARMPISWSEWRKHVGRALGVAERTKINVMTRKRACEVVKEEKNASEVPQMI